MVVGWYCRLCVVVVVFWRSLVDGANLVGEFQMSFLVAQASELQVRVCPAQRIGEKLRLWSVSALCVVLERQC